MPTSSHNLPNVANSTDGNVDVDVDADVNVDTDADTNVRRRLRKTALMKTHSFMLKKIFLEPKKFKVLIFVLQAENSFSRSKREQARK